MHWCAFLASSEKIRRHPRHLNSSLHPIKCASLSWIGVFLRHFLAERQMHILLQEYQLRAPRAMIRPTIALTKVFCAFTEGTSFWSSSNSGVYCDPPVSRRLSSYAACIGSRAYYAIDSIRSSYFFIKACSAAVAALIYI